MVAIQRSRTPSIPGMVIALFLALTITGCGGSSSDSSNSNNTETGGGTETGGTDTGDDGSGSEEDSFTFSALTDLSGSILYHPDSGYIVTMAGDAATNVGISDSGAGSRLMRVFTSFDISELDEDLLGIEVGEATLRVRIGSLLGFPDDELDELQAWLVDYGDSLTGTDFETHIGIYSSLSGSTDQTGLGWREIDVTDAIRKAVDNRDDIEDRAQFQIRYMLQPVDGMGTHYARVCFPDTYCDEDNVELLIELRDPF